jgi:long-chain acyl-CoA synthetase
VNDNVDPPPEQPVTSDPITRRFRPGFYAERSPEQAAVIMGRTGKVVTYAELEAKSAQLAHLLRDRGLRAGDHVAVLMENNIQWLEIAFACMRSGLYWTPINWHLTAGEASYILEDSGARCLITSHAMEALVRDLRGCVDRMEVRLSVGAVDSGFEEYREAVAGYSTDPLADEVHGSPMFYSSGTTGRPKGVLRPFPREPFGTVAPWPTICGRYGFNEDTVYLSPAPLYHAAPGGWTMAVVQHGGTNVIMESFDPGEALALIERYRVTHAQFVPTMFVRMLKLPDRERLSYDQSSLRYAIHAAAPCPIEVKQRMFEWWGPIIYEYYGSSEGAGSASIGPKEWMEHPGSVGKPVSPIHILDPETGESLPSGVPGVLYAESVTFSYHNDPVKSATSVNERGWMTVGDIGYLSDDGYLYLTSRRDDVIISGGVNIYPQETEDLLIGHSAILDVGVIGVANEEFGQEVRAIVQLDPSWSPSAELGHELISWCRDRIAHYKCPVSVKFAEDLPRLPSGKLLRRRLREIYGDSAAESGVEPGSGERDT